ncbi:MAG TPA: sigma-70 family RNA polymerase sigma factor [Acidobacteriaceae bacterium]|nr:sigma-70 family RNA polymerase sigma factor [Acidobacteriaceae bacterium]
MSAREMAPQRLEERQRDVYESHRHRVFSVSYYMTGNEIEAEDLLRGTFISAFRKADEPDQTIIDSSLIDHLRGNMLLEEEEFTPVPAATHVTEQRNIHRADLEEAIRCLPSTERLVFLLMDVEGYPAPRIAQLLQIEESAVRRTVFTARMRLRSELAAMQQDGQQAA